MSNVIIYAVVEGVAEKLFIERILKPYLDSKNIFMTPILISKKGQKGGDIRFARARNDFEKLLKQRRDTYVTTFVDFYGVKEWPGKDVDNNFTPVQKAEYINNATHEIVNELFGGFRSQDRYIPYIAMHEFEAMLFSNPQKLAAGLDVDQCKIDEILAECGEPENINNSQQTAPSKRLERLSGRFRKTTTGVTIAEEIGLDEIREACPIFNEWLKRIERL